MYIALINKLEMDVNRDLLLWVIGHICKELREHATDYLVSEADKNPDLIRVDEVSGTENQQPERLNELSFTVRDCCSRGNDAELLLIPIGKRVKELRHI